MSVSAALAQPALNIEFPPGSPFVNVKEMGAVGDGVADDTAAIRKAIAPEQEGDKTRFVYLPNGTYLISDMLGWSRRRVVIGQSRDGVVLKLKDGAAGYDNPTKPRPVIYTALPGGNYGRDSVANAAFDNYIINLTVDTGRKNPGAIGIRYTTHNQGVVERVLVRSGDGEGAIGMDLAATEFGPGMCTNLTIEGFDIGLRTPGNVSNTVLEHIKLKGQRKCGIENNHPMSLRGLLSENKAPAIRNGGGMAQLVLVDADLRGGLPDQAAIESNGTQVYLRNVKSAGYQAALKVKGKFEGGAEVAEYVGDKVLSVLPSKAQHLKLPIEDPPAILIEPLEKWKVVERSAGDSGAMLQDAFDSGARTVYMKPGSYSLGDTVTIGPSVERVVAYGAAVVGKIETFRDKPMLRIAGPATAKPLVIEFLGGGAWPNQPYAIEIASPRTVYLKYPRFGHPGSLLKVADAAKGGKLFMDEPMAFCEFAPGMSVWMRQCNPENNPYGAGKPLPTYFVNRGAKVWMLGLKTEAPAINVVTLQGGRTEILGGFFRDHYGFGETAKKEMKFPFLPKLPQNAMDLLQKGVPCFITVDSELSASYYNYAHAPGATRELHAIEVRGEQTKELRLPAGNQPVVLYSAWPSGS
jgi:hypothetical protein